jgi:hypothetical protein
MRLPRVLAAVGLVAAVVVVTAAPGSGTTTTTTKKPSSTTSSTKVTSTSSSSSTTTSAIRRTTTTTARARSTTTTTTAAVPQGLTPTTGAPGIAPPAWLVGSVSSGDPTQLVESVHVADSADAARPDVVVRFRSPVEVPATGEWRVDVVTGDPNGARRRASLVSTDGVIAGQVADADPSGAFGDASDTPASLDPSGVAAISLPLEGVPEVDALWVDVRRNDGPPVTTPVWSRTALLGTGTPGVVPSGTIGRATAADGDSSLVAVTDGPELSLVNATLSVTYRTAVPGQIDGQQVTEAFDTVRIVPDFATAGSAADLIRIDHTARTVRLFDAMVLPVEDRSGDGAWLVDPLTPNGVGGVDTVSIDLGAATEDLGRPFRDESSAIALTRTFTLADGRTVSVDGVLGTPQWFATALDTPAGTGPVPGTSASGADTSVPWALIAAIGAAVIVLGGLTLVLLRRRGGAEAEPRHEPDNPFADLIHDHEDPPTLESLAPIFPSDDAVADEAVRLDASAPAISETKPESRPGQEPRSVPAFQPEPESVSTSEPESVPAPEPESVSTSEPESVPAPEPESVPAPEPESVPAPVVDAVPPVSPPHRVVPSADPDAALASFDDELAALAKRLERLADDAEPDAGTPGV